MMNGCAVSGASRMRRKAVNAICRIDITAIRGVHHIG